MWSPMAGFPPFLWLTRTHCLCALNLSYNSPTDGHLGCFCILAIAWMNMGMHISLSWCFHSLQVKAKGGMAGSHSSSIFSFLRAFPTILHSGCTLYSYQQSHPIFENSSLKLTGGVGACWPLAAWTPCLSLCSTFLPHDPVSGDWLYCVHVSRLKICSVTVYSGGKAELSLLLFSLPPMNAV